MRRPIEDQKGQTLALFAIMAIFIVGAVALTVDYGFLATQHRNLQAFADEAAIAGTAQLTPYAMETGAAAAQTAARKAAYIYLRDNLVCVGSATPTSCTAPTALTASKLDEACPPPGHADMFTVDIEGCQLPAPLSSYTLTICTPGQATAASTCTGGNATGQSPYTLSVYVTESVATSLARIIGAGGASAGGFAAATYGYQGGGQAGNAYTSQYLNQYGGGSNGYSGVSTSLAPYARSPWAIWTAGCLSTGSKPEMVQGDVYIDTCGLLPQSGLNSGFCAESSLGSAGNIVYGPLAPPTPTTYLSNQGLATCEAVAGGLAMAVGQVSQLPPGAGVSTPPYMPPPGYTPNYGSQSASAATPTNACTNGETAADGGTVSTCFKPGVYSTITGIANNLNPGVYYIVGDSLCTHTTTSGAGCTGVQFTGNTMNANWQNVADTCWAPPNSVSSGTFVSPCPSGFGFDPTSAVDPMCPVGAPAGYATPAFTLASTIDATGSLDSPGSLSGTRYYVRVSALNSFGETATSESSVVVHGLLGEHAVTVTITPQIGAKYNVYIGTASGAEQLWNTTPSSSTSIEVKTLGTGHGYPRFDTSRCNGFHNIPRWPGDATQNYGVTFVLYNNVNWCAGTCAGAGITPTVLASPYCGGFKLATPAPCPYVTSGTSLNDGAFVIYSKSQSGQLVGQGIGTKVGLTGTVFAPGMSAVFNTGAQLEVLAGQVLAHDMSFESGNVLNPSISYPWGSGYVNQQTPGTSAGGGSFASSGSQATAAAGAPQGAVFAPYVYLIR